MNNLDGVRSGAYKFLNHLCGDELANDNLAETVQFLNHLCGDEPAVTVEWNPLDFLNHLCGDERDA